nr:metallophosphoesterase family protein [uncultured Desulfobacter sp.]
MTPGDNDTKLNFAWYSSSRTNSLVQIALKADMSDSSFPESSAVSFYTTTTSAAFGYYSNKTTVTFLAADTEYVYRVGDGSGNWSDTYSVITSPKTGFSFLAVGDPQIGASNVHTDTSVWTDTLNKALSRFPDMAFIMSAGDQVQTKNSERQFDDFFEPKMLRHIPIAPALGNHDNGAENTEWHFNLPNLSAVYGVTSPGGADYYFTHGNALFVILNSNNNNGSSHKAFINSAVAANPDVKWKIAMFHHDIYGSASHARKYYVKNLRAALFPIFDAYRFDVVICGHDHSYSRSHVLNADVPQKDQTYDENGAVVNPNGTVYFTLNSASGSKHYDLNASKARYCAFRWQNYKPSFSRVTINGNTLTFNTYESDTMALIDSFSIAKSPVSGVTDAELKR